MDKFVLKCRLFETCKTIYKKELFHVLNQFIASFFHYNRFVSKSLLSETKPDDGRQTCLPIIVRVWGISYENQSICLF